MKSISTYARRALFLVLAAVIALAAADSVIAAKPVVIEGATLNGDVVTIWLTNSGKKQSQVLVAARYLVDENLIETEKIVLVPGSATTNVSLSIGGIIDDSNPMGIIDDPNPMGIIEGPDPIGRTIAVSAIMWSD